MNFFQSVFWNQYATISRRNGNTRIAQFYTILVSASLITLYLLIIAALYARLNPYQAEADLINSESSGKLLAAGAGLVIFFTVRFLIGSKEWYEKTVELFLAMNAAEQQRAAKKGGRYLFIASLPVVIFILWLLASLF
jgi:hypothetical protein